MRILSIEEAKAGEFPKKRALRLYSGGCNLRCSYCGFSEYIRDCADEGMGWDSVSEQLVSRLGNIDGVIFTGGEPTVHEELTEWIQNVRDLGLAVMLETNGTRPDYLRQLLDKGLLDYVAMDVKAPLDNYRGIAGVGIDKEALRSSIWSIRQAEVRHEFRTTVVPGLHTARELKMIVELVHGADKFVVQDFISTNPLRRELRGRPAFPKKTLEELRKFVERRVKEYEIRHFEDAKPMPELRRKMRETIGMN